MIIIKEEVFDITNKFGLLAFSSNIKYCKGTSSLLKKEGDNKLLKYIKPNLKLHLHSRNARSTFQL